MKIALVNLANNVTDFSTTPSGETIYIKQILKNLGFDVNIISKENGEHTISFDSVFDINDYDRLIVINGVPNFFGGAENQTVMSAYMLMAKYNKPIHYFLTDLRLAFKQVWPMIKNRKEEWVKKYSEETTYVKSPIIVVSQGENIDIAKKLHKDLENLMSVVYFPIERYKVVLKELQVSPSVPKTCDLIYGGSARGGSRDKKILEYLFDHDELNVQLFGTIKQSQFEDYNCKHYPTFGKKVPMTEVTNKISEGYASIIIGDKTYYDNMITLRVWETLASDAVCFIDNDFDTKHRILPLDFFYVKSKQELIEKIKLIKEDSDMRLAYLRVQHWAFESVDPIDYYDRLNTILSDTYVNSVSQGF